MTVRRFGPVFGAGTVINEKEAAKSITPSSYGNTAYTGIMQRGPINKLFEASKRREYLFRCGTYIPESQLPDASFDTYRRSEGAGRHYFLRITDGNEKESSLTLFNRRSPKGSVITCEAGNAGRWAGKKQAHIDEYDSVTATTLQMDNVPSSLQEDELVGALVVFNAIPGKSYKVVSNDDAGLLTFDADIDVVTDLGGSADKLYSVSMTNEDQAVGVKIMEGTDNPTTEWRMLVYNIDAGVMTLRKDFDNMSSDPNASNYFVNIVNDDSDSEFLLKVTDEHIGSITADVRPANYFNKSLTLTSTVLTAKVWNEVISSVAGALAEAMSFVAGASIIEDDVTLTNTAAGTRSSETATFAANPADGDTILINGSTFTFKTTVADATTEILIGADAEATIDNTVAFINASEDVNLQYKVFAEKATASTMILYAMTAGSAGDAITTPAGAGSNPPTWGAVTLSGGVDQTWTYASAKMPFITGQVVTSGVAFTAPNVYGFGFTLIDTTKDSTKMFAVADTIKIEMRPFVTDELVEGFLVPKESLYRQKFEIIENTANTVTVKTGSDMTANAAAGDEFRVEYVQELGGGYDGIAQVDDTQYINAYDAGSSPLRNLRGKNLGLVKLATPGVTSTLVQKAGASFGDANNWQYRYEVPSNIVSESAAEEYINDTLGRNDMAVGSFPSYAYVDNPTGEGLKLTTLTGLIIGKECKYATDYLGYHKAASDINATIPEIVKLPDGLQDVLLDEEVLNPLGLSVIKKEGGNFVIWGDRTLGTDSSFKFKHHRETLSHYENTFLENWNFIIFGLNNVEKRILVETAFRTFFELEYAKGAIVGDDVDDAAPLKIDDENNPQASIENGDLNAEVGVRIVGVIERFIITISRLGITESFG